MLKIEAQSLGGKSTAKIQRENALIRYYNNPNYCIHCNKIIEVPDGVKCSEIRLKKFCNSSCSAKYNNRHRIRKVRVKEIKIKKKIIVKFEYLANMNKKNVFDIRKSWQSARGTIQQNARYIYNNSGKPKCCVECGYNKHIEICHIKSVSSFTDSASVVNEINNIENLVALCPTHHWEFDKGLLKIN